MPTTMLDALAAEAQAVTDLGIAASRLAMEASGRANLLAIQIAHLAAEEREDGFRDTPGKVTAVQESGAVEQGSDASAPGGVATRTYAESEQAVAEAVTGEQDSVVCKDPGTAPDATPPGPLCELHAEGWRATYRGQTLQFARTEFRLLVALNDQAPVPIGVLIDHCMIGGRRAVLKEIMRLNPRIALIGIQIRQVNVDLFALCRLVA